jgi:type I restriction enzyme S subunit
MTANDLIAAFETLADAPDGVKRLRELVLQLAVRGKLVVSAAGEWPTVALSDVVEDFQNGTSSRGGERGEPVVVLRLADIKQGRIAPSSFRKIDLSADSAAKYRVREGDVLAIRVNGSGDLVGRMILVEKSEEWCYCDHLIRIRLRANTLAPRFLSLFGNTPDARDHLSSVTVTTAGQKTVNQKGLGSLRVPLPPLAEQHRVVARVDELMGLLDRLEAARTARDDVRRAARDAALAALRDAEDTDAVEAAWGRLAGQMDALFAEPEDVGPLRQAVLGLAVRGRLVPQDPKEESADPLLGNRAHRPANPPWRQPKGWAWSTIALLGDVLGGGTPSKSNSAYWEGHIPWVSPKDMKVPWLSDSQDHVSVAAVEGSSTKLIPAGALLMVVRGMILAHSFPVAVTRVDVTVNQDMKVLVPYRSGLAPFLLVMMQGSRDRVLGLVEHSTHGTCKLPFASLSSLPLPIPPLAEQHRIVAKVDALMAICDALEARLTTARDLHGQFAAAAVHHLDV